MAYLVAGGVCRGSCELCGNHIPDSMGWAHLYSFNRGVYLGACSVECWRNLKLCEKPYPYPQNYADDAKVAALVGRFERMEDQ